MHAPGIISGKFFACAHGARPPRFVDALAELGIADAELLVTFAVQLGGDPDMETMDFDEVEAKSVAETIRNLKPPDPHRRSWVS